MLIVFTNVCKLRGGYRVAGQVAWCEAEQKGGIGGRGASQLQASDFTRKTGYALISRIRLILSSDQDCLLTNSQ